MKFRGFRNYYSREIKSLQYLIPAKVYPFKVFGTVLLGYPIAKLKPSI